MKKIILIIAAIIIIGAGIEGYFVFQKSVPAPKAKCPQYAPPAPSFYENCEKKGGKVQTSEKDKNGCLSHPQCVLPKKLN